MILIASLVMLLLSFLGMPIAWSLGIGSLTGILMHGSIPADIIAQKIISGMNSFSLMAIPFFILSGNLMAGGGLTKRLINIARVLVGWVKGSLSIISVVSSAFFGSITGSAIATASSIGGMLIPEMIDDGYDRSFAASVTTASAILGPLIPPSIGLIVFASLTNVSVKELFIGTLLPAILYALGLIIIFYLIASKRKYPTKPKSNLREIFAVLKSGTAAIIMPLIVLGFIFGGITTPTEASIIAVVYALIVGLFIHKDLKIADLPKILLDTAISTAVMFMLIGISGVLGWLMAFTNTAGEFASFLSTLQVGSKFIPLAIITLICLVLGCLMDVVANILILTPVFYNLAPALGYSGVEFGVILITLLTLGHLTPPFGASLLLSNQIAKANIGKTIIEVFPMIVWGIALCIILWVFPQIISVFI